MNRWSITLLTVAAVAMGGAGQAAAATPKPSVSTGGVSKVTFQSARLHATVNPNGAATTYLFQYGPTRAYGSSTPMKSVGSGKVARKVSVDIASLSPVTTYHYRIVALNPGGSTSGADRTFKTAKQPLGLTIAATPNPVPYNTLTAITGTLAGTGAGNRPVVLQQRPFPYTAPFAQVGNPLLTAADGTFSFPGIAVPINTQYRVVSTGTPRVTSPIVTAGVTARVSTTVRTETTRGPGKLVRFSGHVRPVEDVAQVGIQKLTKDGRWVTVAGSITHRAAVGVSRYALRTRVRHSGSYRIYVLITNGKYVSGIGRTVELKAR